jgi:hypothetical protein
MSSEFMFVPRSKRVLWLLRASQLGRCAAFARTNVNFTCYSYSAAGGTRYIQYLNVSPTPMTTFRLRKRFLIIPFLILGTGFIAVLVGSISLYRAWQSPTPNFIQYVVASEGAPQNPFDPNVWKGAFPRAYRSNLRLQMINDLFRQHNGLIGLTQADVLKLLGQPHSYVADGQLIIEGKVDQPVDRMNYGIGRRYSGETLQLDIEFQDGRVVKAYIDES